MLDRRTVLQGATAGAAMFSASPLLGASPPSIDSVAELALDEAYWAKIAAQYDVTDKVIQLENGNWGMMSRPVLAAYQQSVERVNRESSYYARRGMGADLQAAHAALVRFLKVEPDEVVLTRNATEALKALIGGYNRIGPGDTALFADLDYDSMQASLEASMARRGARAVKIALPEPATYDAIIAAYADAFARHPELKLVLLTHISHRTGLMIPVREISAMARERGIDVIVDAAHSLGQVDYDIAELGADFVGINLHKWMGAPLGVGAAYIRKGRVSAIDPDIADGAQGSGAITSRVHTGTVDFAAILTLPDALAFQAKIGGAAREARLRALRDRWAEQVRSLPSIEVLTPDDPRMHGGITSFRIADKTSTADNIALAGTLLDRFGIFTVHRTGLASGACVRVTPALFNSMADSDALVAALRTLA